MRTVDVQVNLISSREYLENVVTYVLRNPIAAGIKVLPNHYRWSSADLYFRGEFQETGERLNDLSDRKRFRIMRSRVQVPDNYIVDADGMVLPSCYVDSSTMEDLFRHPSRLLMLLAKRVENDVELQLGIAEQIGMTDQDILTQMPVLIRKEFGKDSIEQLSMEQRIRLCVLLKRNYNAGIKQIARITRLEPEAVAKVV